MTAAAGPATGESAAPLFGVVAVVGLGLMGGSLCRTLRRVAPGARVLGVDRSPVEGTRALESGAIDRYDPDGSESVAAADLVVYATPLGATLELVARHAKLLRTDALVTDVVSLKAPVLRGAALSGVGARFVGAHPICGAESSGFEAAQADLFRGATVWLCAREEATPDARARVERFWMAVGGVPHWAEAEEHDRRMAWVSHLPQLVANALAGALDAAGCQRAELGPGGRDMTRLAGSNPEIWRDLLEASAPVTGLGLTSVANGLNVLADLLARRDVDRIAEFMERTRRWSRSES
jgi:prephenate dehydrogenase